MITRREAHLLLNEWVKSESLRKHCQGVAAAMEGYANAFFSEGKISETDIDNWYIAGLLHDFDYEKFPDINIHPKEGCKLLKDKEYPNEVIQAILGHNETTGVARATLMAKALFAVDELTGLIMALAKVRPGNFYGMKASSVKKVIKKKDFAAAINRMDIEKGIRELGYETEQKVDQHFETIIQALSRNKESLGF